MVSSRIKNPDLAAQIDEGQLAWQRYITPITEHYCRQITQGKASHRYVLNLFQHLNLFTSTFIQIKQHNFFILFSSKEIPTFLPEWRQAGVRICCGLDGTLEPACNALPT